MFDNTYVGPVNLRGTCSDSFQKDYTCSNFYQTKLVNLEVLNHFIIIDTKCYILKSKYICDSVVMNKLKK